MVDLEKRAKAWDEFSSESMEWTVSNTFNAAYELGVRDGAASVDRKAIVREAFEKVKEILPSISLGDFEEDDYPKAMDAILETIGEVGE